MISEFPLPADTSSCYTKISKAIAKEIVSGWKIRREPNSVFLVSPDGKQMSPNDAPFDVQGAFRTWLNERDL